MDDFLIRRPLPKDLESFDRLHKCNKIIKFVSFLPENSSVIVYKGQVVGFYQTFVVEEDPLIYEITIGIFPEFRRMGIARMLFTILEKNLFSNDQVMGITLNIDEDNQNSLALASSLGYTEELEGYDFYLGKTKRTKVFMKYNPNYEKRKEK